MRVFLLAAATTGQARHAVFAGADDPLLTDAVQVEVPRRLGAVYAGAEMRCWDTAAALSIAPSDMAPAGLDYGKWTGHTLDEVSSAQPDAVLQWLTDPTFTPPGGNSIENLVKRIRIWLAALVADQPSPRVLAVVDTSVVSAALVVALAAPLESYWRFDLPPGTLVELNAKDGRWNLVLG